jgi:hypothetical protein
VGYRIDVFLSFAALVVVSVRYENEYEEGQLFLYLGLSFYEENRFN